MLSRHKVPHAADIRSESGQCKEADAAVAPQELGIRRTSLPPHQVDRMSCCIWLVLCR